MKILTTIFLLIVFSYSYVQEEAMIGEKKLKNFEINISVDSEKDLNSTFTVSELEDVLENIASNETIYFKLTCNHQSKNGQKNIAYTVTGNSNDPKIFLDRIKKVKKSANSFYQTKV